MGLWLIALLHRGENRGSSDTSVKQEEISNNLKEVTISNIFICPLVVNLLCIWWVFLQNCFLTILPNHSLILIIIINKKFCLANSQRFPISHLWPHVSADGNMFQNLLSNNMEQSRQIILLHCQSKIKDVSSYLYSTSSSSGRSDRKIFLLINNRNADMNILQLHRINIYPSHAEQ